MDSISIPGSGAPWQEWHALAATLDVPEGVHRPSPFSAQLATSLPDLTGQVVVDAGSGAGLISLAALAAGADHVIAVDLDLDALAATRANVERVLGDSGRLSLLQSDFRMLHLVNADVLLANPPQRPARVLEQVPAAERRVHEGGGEDGLDAVRMLLDHACTAQVWTTAAGVLDAGALRHPRWSAPRLESEAHVPMDAVWRVLGDDDRVTVWRFDRA